MAMTDVGALAERFPAIFSLVSRRRPSRSIEGASKRMGASRRSGIAFSNMRAGSSSATHGDVACDHYNRLQADLDLIASLGVGAYRFSIAWPRILPDGTGAVNGKGLDFYECLVDGLKARGIKAFANALPLGSAADSGGRWRLDAAGRRRRPLPIMRGSSPPGSVTGGCSGDLQRTLVLLSGCRISTASMRRVSAISMRRCTHCTRPISPMASGCRRSVPERADLPVGIVLNAHSIYPGSDAAADVAAAERAHAFHNGVFFGPIFKGAYPDAFLQALGERMPEIRPGDMAAISQRSMVGAELFTRRCGSAMTRRPASISRPTVSAPAVHPEKTDIGWEIHAPAHGDLVRRLNRDYPLPPCYITGEWRLLQHGRGGWAVAMTSRGSTISPTISA